MKKIILFLVMLFVVSAIASAAKVDSDVFYKLTNKTPEEFQVKYGISAQKFYDAVFLLKETFIDRTKFKSTVYEQFFELNNEDDIFNLM